MQNCDSCVTFVCCCLSGTVWSASRKWRRTSSEQTVMHFVSASSMTSTKRPTLSRHFVSTALAWFVLTVFSILNTDMLFFILQAYVGIIVPKLCRLGFRKWYISTFKNVRCQISTWYLRPTLCNIQYYLYFYYLFFILRGRLFLSIQFGLNFPFVFRR